MTGSRHWGDWAAAHAQVLSIALFLVLACALGSTVLAAAGGSRRDLPADVLQIARQQLGDPYQWGGQGPDAWDCSGLTSYMWREVGGVKDIPRVSRDQAAWAVPIPREQLLVGDLVVGDLRDAVGGGGAFAAGVGVGGVVVGWGGVRG